MWRIFVGWNVTTGGATSRAVCDYLYPMKALLRWFDSCMPSTREQCILGTALLGTSKGTRIGAVIVINEEAKP